MDTRNFEIATDFTTRYRTVPRYLCREEDGLGSVAFVQYVTRVLLFYRGRCRPLSSLRRHRCQMAVLIILRLC